MFWISETASANGGEHSHGRRTIEAVIAVQLTGGMGNQMFQYATARALAARRRAELLLDSSWIEGTGGSVTGEVRRFELRYFTLDAPLAPVDRVAHVGRPRLALLRRRPTLQPRDEPPFGRPQPGVVDAPDDTYLRGYWQNTSYFGDAKALLRRDFTFRPSIVEQAARTEAAIESSPLPAVAVHVRRSDYVTDPGVRDRMGTLEPQYYRRAVATISGRVGDVRLFLFTDDHDWCATRLTFDHDTTVVAATRAEGDMWASIMYLMTCCDHHVLANSSFSWWGAWLNPRADKIVVTPKPWLVDPRWDDSHRIPHAWIRIDRDGHQADQPPSTTTFAPVT
jgi:hypothetical protein